MHPSMRRLYDSQPAKTQAHLARAMNESAQTINNWEARGISKEGALKAQAAFGTNALWLLEGKGEPSIGQSPAEAKEWSDVLAYAQAAGLGTGAEANEWAETNKLKFRADSLARKRLNPMRLAVMYGKGDSMLPRIHSGDAILFDTGDTKPRDGGLFVVLWKGEYYVKRCELLDDLVLFKSDNPDGDHHWKKAKRMDAKDAIEIVGRVRWLGSWEG